jgi:hypothetical protein
MRPRPVLLLYILHTFEQISVFITSPFPDSAAAVQCPDLEEIVHQTVSYQAAHCLLSIPSGTSVSFPLMS